MGRCKKNPEINPELQFSKLGLHTVNDVSMIYDGASQWMGN